VRDRTTTLLALAAAALAGLAWWQGGAELAVAGLLQGGRALVGVAPILFFAFLIAGLVHSLVTKEVITRWLGEESGWRGIILACLGGALMPGGPYVYYPIAAALFQAGASLGVLVAFITAKNLWSLSRLPMEFALLGPHVTIVRLASTLLMPPLLGFAADLLFGRQVEHIRSGATL